MSLVEGLVAVLISLENPRWLFALIYLNFQETVFFLTKSQYLDKKNQVKNTPPKIVGN